MFQTNVPVSLTLNGVDYSSQLTSENLPEGTYSGEADLNQFYAGTQRAAVLYIKNSSNVDVNIKVELKEFDGSNFTGNHTARYGFSSVNDPVGQYAPLPAGILGDIVFNNRNLSF